MNPYPSYPPPPGQIMPLAGPGPSAPPAQQPVYVFSLPGAPPGMASASFASSSGGGGDDCCGGGCCSSRSLLQPLRTPTEAALPPLRALGCASLGLGIAFLLNGGWAVMSSIFVIAHGALLVGYTGKSRALEEVVHEVKAASGTACCTRKRHMQLRSLAVAAIVFACMEMLLAMGLGWGLGGGIGQPLSTSFLTDPRNNVRVCNSLQCLSGVTSATWSNSASTPEAQRQALQIFMQGALGGSQYLFYASGATLYAAITNIALSAACLQGVETILQLSL